MKHFMRKHSTPFLDRPEWPEPKENPEYCLSLANRKAIVHSEEEVGAKSPGSECPSFGWR